MILINLYKKIIFYIFNINHILNFLLKIFTPKKKRFLGAEKIFSSQEKNSWDIKKFLAPKKIFFCFIVQNISYTIRNIFFFLV